MNCNLFAERLSELASLAKNFEKMNRSDGFVKQLQASYSCLEKPAPTPDFCSEDELVKLVANYDCSEVVVGPVEFLSSPSENESQISVGRVDLDNLIIDQVSSVVEVVDHDDASHVVWQCAGNGSKFLDAILVCAQELTARMTSTVDDPEKNAETINLCTALAGGSEYKDFYEMLLQL